MEKSKRSNEVKYRRGKERGKEGERQTQIATQNAKTYKSMT